MSKKSPKNRMAQPSRLVTAKVRHDEDGYRSERGNRRPVRALLAAAFLSLITGMTASISKSALAAPPAEQAVKIENLSKPVLCAEEDNVTLTLASPNVRKFRIEARHPAYLAGLREDNWDANWTSCTFGPAAKPAPANPATTPSTKPHAKPIRTTLYETLDRWLVGIKLPNFWREVTATVRVGDTVTEGIHLLQLWRVRPNGGEEVLVLYPQDGYWRARPLAPKGRDLTAFGSSFLIGPIEQAGRPVVRIKQVTYDPALEGFDLAFADGNSARIKLAEISASRLALDVSFKAPVKQRPFAALRSMYVSALNNDVAAVAVRNPNGWREHGIMTFKGATTPELWTGRQTISRHNTSSPDMLFNGFQGE